MEEDVDVYFMARDPAAVPLKDERAIQRVHDILVLRDENDKEIEIKITDTYGKTRKDSAGNSKEHHGWDIAAPKGSLIRWNYNEAATTIKHTAYSAWGWQNGRANYGYQVSVVTTRDDSEYVLRFCHLLNDVAQQWKIGTVVAQGAAIAKVGTSGRMPNAANPHLHLEVFKKVDKQFKRIDPIDFFRLVADGSIQAPTGLRITQ
jgi:murein DD-endopeptidase MepM/ murein hydrolase activator NlpD